MGAGSALYVLPILISGYLVGILSWPTRFFLVRIDGQRLFFACACIGVVWVSALFCTFYWIRSLELDFISKLAKFVHTALPFDHSAKFLACIVLAVVAPLLLNGSIRFCVWVARFFGVRHDTAYEIINRVAVRNYGGPLSRMLTDAADSQRLVMVSLSSRKVYCGYVTDVGPEIDKDGYLGILPIKSYTREKDSLKFTEEVEYHAVKISLLQKANATNERLLAQLETALRRLSAKINSRTDEALEKERNSLTQEMAALKISITSNAEVLDKLGLGGVLIEKDWTKLIPASAIETVSYYDEIAPTKWFAKAATDSQDQPTPPPAESSKCDRRQVASSIRQKFAEILLGRPIA